MKAVGRLKAIHSIGEIPGQGQNDKKMTMIKKTPDQAPHPDTSAAALRNRAEAIARQKAVPAPEDLGTLSPEAARQMPRELRDHQIELEMQNAELRRTQAELEEQKAKLETQLQQVRKMEFVGRLAGGVAHDFNNMLQIILGIAELRLPHAGSDAALTADLNEIKTVARRSADLTQQLLAFARKSALTPKVFDLNDTVAGLYPKLTHLIGADIDLVWRPAPNLWPVNLDPTQFEQILANLMLNARDANAGVDTVILETGNAEFDETFRLAHPEVVPGAYVKLAVTNTGCGMDNAPLEHLSEPFFSTGEQDRGMGFDLAAVSRIVKQNHGFLNVNYEAAKGATFTLYLPRHAAKTTEPAEKPEDSPAPTGTETVLLVEDEAPLLRLARRLLESLGYTVLTADSPDAALRLAEAYRDDIHLLLTDVVMPEMSGRDLRDQFSTTRPAMKCLFMSGYAANVIAHHGVLGAGLYFIQKPFTKTAIAMKIREVLAGPSDRVLTTNRDKPADAATQRRRAENSRWTDTVNVTESLSPETARQMLHELQVHQLELEMQNEELHRAQTKLDAALARYIDLYNQAPVGYCTLSEKGLILKANLTAANLLGVARDALVKQPLTRYILPVDQEIWSLHHKQLHETGTPQECEFRMLRADATPFWVQVKATMVQPLATDPGPAANSSSECRIVLSDITERKRAEEALREGEERLSMALLGAGLGTWDRDVQTGKIVFNARWTEMLGYTLAEIEPHFHAWHALVHADDQPRVMAALNAHLEGRTDSYVTEYRMRHKTGKWIWILGAGRVIERDAHGKPLRICGTHLDITARKQTEAALRASEARLRQLALELSRVEERERQRLAVCLHDMIAQNLAVLQVKLGILAATRDADSTPVDLVQIRDLLGETIDQTHSLVFDLSPPILYQLGLAAAMEWAGEKIGREHKLRFVCRADGETKSLDDERQALLFRCTHELMMNTVRHAQATLLSTAVVWRDNQVCVTVEDDGCGFDVSRLDRWTPGVGFGLFSVRERLSAIGGQCQIVSNPDRGTRVTLTVPFQPLWSAPISWLAPLPEP